MTRAASNWEGLTPWEKAAQWHATAPHIADEIMELARKHAEQEWQLRLAAAEHSRRMEIEAAEHNRRMDVRLWLTQVAAFVGGLGNVAALTALAWHFADTGNLIPGLTLFGAGTGLTAGVFAAGRSIIRRQTTPPQTTGAQPTPQAPADQTALP